MKMYIIVKDNIPDHLVPVITAHASLACYLKYEQDDEMKQWINSVFKKVVCKVTEAEFEKAMQVEKNVLLTESAMNNQQVCLAFSPRKEYPKFFKFFRLWNPQAE